jgi:hypothetical protein
MPRAFNEAFEMAVVADARLTPRLRRPFLHHTIPIPKAIAGIVGHDANPPVGSEVNPDVSRMVLLILGGKRG